MESYKIKLFEDMCTHAALLFNNGKKLPIGIHQTNLKEMQYQAVREIHRQLGVDGIINLCNSSNELELLGEISAHILFEKDAKLLLLRMKHENDRSDETRRFISGFMKIGRNFDPQKLIKTVDKLTNSNLTLFMTPSLEWNEPKPGSELEADFWEMAEINSVLVPDNKTESIARKLLQFGRPADALFVLGLIQNQEYKNFSHMNPKLLQKILDSMPFLEKTENFLFNKDTSILGTLASLEGSLSQRDMANLEYIYICTSEFNGTTPSRLAMEMSENPDFFCMMVSDMLGKGNWFQHGPVFLERYFKLTPELYSNKEKLKNWISEVMKLAKNYPDTEHIDYFIGSLLGKTKNDNFDEWPSYDSIADLVQEISNNQKILDGILEQQKIEPKDRNAWYHYLFKDVKEHEKRVEKYTNSHPKVAEIIRRHMENRSQKAKKSRIFR